MTEIIRAYIRYAFTENVISSYFSKENSTAIGIVEFEAKNAAVFIK